MQKRRIFRRHWKKDGLKYLHKSDSWVLYANKWSHDADVQKVAAAHRLDWVILWLASCPRRRFLPAIENFSGHAATLDPVPLSFDRVFILAFLFRRSVAASVNELGGRKPAVLLLFGCALVFLCSELIQFYIPSRTPAIRDIAVDQSGAMFALTILRHWSEKLLRVAHY
jgi:hypothetical protein